MNNVKEIHVAVARCETTDEVIYKTGINPRPAAISVFNSLLDLIQKEKWKDYKKDICIYKVFTYDPQNIAGFQPSLIQFNKDGTAITPGTTDMILEGKLQVGLQSIGSRYQYETVWYPDKKTVRFETAN